MALACSSTPQPDRDLSGGGTMGDTGTTSGATTPGTGSVSQSDSTGSDGSDGALDDEGSSGGVFDVAQPPPPPVDECDASDLDALADNGAPTCADTAPPDNFDPVTEWSYPPRGEVSWGSEVIALVANMTDDNDNGEIDMCDTPDVIVSVQRDGDARECEIHVVDGNYGETGVVHAVIDHPDLYCLGTPAVGDIDGDGQPDIVAVTDLADERIIAFEADGTLKWISEPNPHLTDPLSQSQGAWRSGAVAIDDLDGDGTAEISYAHLLYDSDGAVLWSREEQGFINFLQAPMVVDLDDDGRRELVLGYSAYAFDDAWNATELWNLYDFIPSADHPHQTFAQVANFDDEPMPEVFLSNARGNFLLEHDGTVIWGPVVPAESESCDLSSNGRMRPAVLFDANNDGKTDVGLSLCDEFYLFEIDEVGMTVMFSAPVQDGDGSSGSTAFDFLGDGMPEPVYSDRVAAYAWSHDGDGWETRLDLPRVSGTWMEFPVVADTDNDGSAEILVVSRGDAPALQVFGDEGNDWIQARRIWNQHAYTVTNISEDGHLPDTRLNHWEHLNTVRSNSQIESGVPCVPAG
ncbi:MAG: VCBS repeat-containing protein [Myxococcota bacterium]